MGSLIKAGGNFENSSEEEDSDEEQTKEDVEQNSLS